MTEFFRYELMSLKATASLAAFFCSNAHCWIAPSIWRRLLMQAFIWAVVRALMKLGIAMAANRPIMATTIMISTRVKPRLRGVLTFIFWTFRFGYGVNTATSGLYMITDSVHELLVANRVGESS